MNLSALAASVRDHPGLTGKSDLAAVARTLGGDGDDAAVVADAGGHLVMAAEAIWPPFVAAQPRVAGVAGVVTVLNDLAATGARPIALLDCLVAASGAVAAEILEGLRIGAELYGVPDRRRPRHHRGLGGPGPVHLRRRPGDRAAVGAQRRARATPVNLAVCLEGEMVTGPEGLFFSHLRGPRRDRAAADLALLADAAEAGEAWAARDVSMPGVAGSLLQFCESAGGLGCALDLDALPAPAGIALADWLLCFPSYGFLLAGDPDALAARFGAAGLTLARVGTLDASGAAAPAGGRSRGARLGSLPRGAHRPTAARVLTPTGLRRASP